MADLLAKSKSSIRNLALGQKVRGTVIQKLDKSLILDIQGKAEGVVSEKAFAEAREYISKLKVGDEVIATVLVPEMRDGSTLLSLRDSVSAAVWQHIEESYKNKTEVAVFAKAFAGSGITVDVNGVAGFIPTSQLSKEFSKNPASLVGKYFKAKVIELDKQKNKLVLSEREVTDAKDIALAKKALESVKDGDVFEGIVTTVANFGIFVKIIIDGSNVEGLVHISELDWGLVDDPRTMFKVGDKVRAKVIEIKDGKVSLSVKALKENPWKEFEGKLKKGDIIKGVVIKYNKHGALVSIKEGVAGLVHNSTFGSEVKLREKLELGKNYNFQITLFEPKEHKMTLVHLE